MKKILLLILLSISIYSCKTQKEINFNVSYLPNSLYTKTQKNVTESYMKYIASDEIMQKLKEQGIENLSVTKDSSFLKYKTNTGTIVGNEFPIVLEPLESEDPFMDNNSKFYGKSVEGKIQIDSISSTTFTQQEKAILFPILESMIDKVNYPKRKFKVGESFQQEDPLQLPLATGEAMDIMINSIYTLKKVKRDIGYFDLEQHYHFTSPLQDFEVEIEGIGKGKVKYDIEKQSIINYYVEMKSLLKSDLEDFSIQLESKIITEQTTEVIKNP